MREISTPQRLLGDDVPLRAVCTDWWRRATRRHCYRVLIAHAVYPVRLTTDHGWGRTVEATEVDS